MMIEEGKNTLNSWSFFGRGLCSQSSYMYLSFSQMRMFGGIRTRMHTIPVNIVIPQIIQLIARRRGWHRSRVNSCSRKLSPNKLSNRVLLRAMSRKETMTTKFELEKFDENFNFLLWKIRVTLLLVKEGTLKAMHDIEKKPSKLEDDEWNDINFRSKTTIILCLSDEVFYNIIN